MEHKVRNFDHLIGTMGFSEKLLKDHFTLYAGYVKKLNEIETKLKTIDKNAANYSFNEFSELKRREAVAFNGTYLHEMYFENMTKISGQPEVETKKLAEASFGSWENLIKDIRATASSTHGWVLLTYSKVDKQLHTYITFEHHIGLPAHQEIILALNCWEHAFMLDYGINKAGYLDAFFAAVDWKVVEDRLKKANK